MVDSLLFDGWIIAFEPYDVLRLSGRQRVNQDQDRPNGEFTKYRGAVGDSTQFELQFAPRYPLHLMMCSRELKIGVDGRWTHLQDDLPTPLFQSQ